MYQLWGGGAPFSVVDPELELRDISGTPVRLLGSIGDILYELKNEEVWKDTKVAWVSCTDEPSWANECMRKFQVKNGDAVISMAQSSQIFKANKQEHFKNLKKEFRIDFEDMLFFDNEMGNIRSVSKLGVKSIYCPDGMLREVWDSALKDYAHGK